MKNKLTGALLMLGSPETQADIRSFSGFSAPDNIVYVQNNRQKWLIVSSLEFGRALKEVPHLTVINATQLGLESLAEKRSSAHWALALLRRENITSCIVPPWFPMEAARVLEQANIELNIDSRCFIEKRLQKSDSDIELLRASQRAAVAGVEAAVHQLRAATVNEQNQLVENGQVLTSEMVRSSIEKKLLDLGCAAPAGTIVACGTQSADPHQSGAGPLFAHQPIVMDIFPRSQTSGFWGDITRTISIGPPAPEVIRMYEAVCRAQQVALDLIRPRIKASTVHQAVVRSFEQSGFETILEDGIPTGFIHSTGHGVGFDIHEHPFISSGNDTLRKGQVITVEPGLYYPQWGGVRVEDTIEITADGWRYLATMSKEMVMPCSA